MCGVLLSFFFFGGGVWGAASNRMMLDEEEFELREGGLFCYYPLIFSIFVQLTWSR